MNRHRIASLVVVLITIGCQPASDTPNVILIVTDDQGWVDLGSYGADVLSTPHLDTLAASGLRFTDFYTAAASCSPSRAAFLTGMYPQRIGIPGVLMPQSRRGLHPDERTLAEMLKDLGYATAIYGKWHLGHDSLHLPLQHGFDEYFGIPYSNDMTPDAIKNPNPPARQHPPVPLVEGFKTIELEPDQSQLTRRYTERATRFIDTNHDTPFFLYLPHTFPHVPLFVSDDFDGQSGAGLYADVILEIDWSAGQIMEALKRHDLIENTLVIFSSDNGPWLIKGDHSGHTGPLREGKGTTFEGGHRVPLLMSWPGVITPGVTDAMVSAIDVMPTIAAFTGAPPGPFPFDGESLVNVIHGGTSPHEALFFYQGYQLHAVRSGRWKLHAPHHYRSIHGATLSTPTFQGAYRQDSIGLSLFDLQSDIGEMTNLADSHPDVVDRLLGHMNTMREDLGDRLTDTAGNGRRPSLVLE